MKEFFNKVLYSFVIMLIIIILGIFGYFIQKQSHLDMKELEEIVEKELIEKHGNKN